MFDKLMKQILNDIIGLSLNLIELAGPVLSPFLCCTTAFFIQIYNFHSGCETV